MPNDTDFMARALQLAQRGRGLVEPNPMVGAVLVQNGVIVGEGWHQKYGQAHAEVNAFAAAKDQANGATLYVTLEPCCHFGKTPPCTEAVLRSGVRRVVIAMLDPFPQVAGQGSTRLKEEGLDVQMGLLESEARFLNAPYLKLLQTGKPFVHAKWAMSLDGKIATRTGQSKWITSEAARQQVHHLRGLMDAILIGSQTYVQDDPLLTVRPPGPRIPCRIVVTRGQQMLPTDRQLIRTLSEAPVLFITTKEGVSLLQPLQDLGCEVLAVDASKDGYPLIDALLLELGKRRMTNIWIEGGANLLGAFVDAQAIDEVHAFIAPKILGGAKALPAVTGLGSESVDQAIQLTAIQVQSFGRDIYVHGRVQR